MTTDNLPDLQWFPGHMKKARQTIEKNLPLVDVVLELLDARIPLSSSNPLLAEIIADKPRLIVLNKADLADSVKTRTWIEKFTGKNITAVPLNGKTGQGGKEIVRQSALLAKPFTHRLVGKGAKPRPPRLMILGIPNVGKSTLINRLAGGTRAKVANTPGVTRAKQWISVDNRLDLLDTPGVLWPKFEDKRVGLNLAIVGAIRDEIFAAAEVSMPLLTKLRRDYPQLLRERYKLTEELPESATELMEIIGKKRGCLLKGGIIDTDKVARLVLTEFRAGLLGRITLEE